MCISEVYPCCVKLSSGSASERVTYLFDADLHSRLKPMLRNTPDEFHYVADIRFHVFTFLSLMTYFNAEREAIAENTCTLLSDAGSGQRQARLEQVPPLSCNYLFEPDKTCRTL